MDDIKEMVVNARISGEMSESQIKAFEAFKRGENILLMGEAGTGKSRCIKYFVEYAEYSKMRINVTATTGVAAFNISGITIHSFLGISNSDMDVRVMLSRARGGSVLKRIKNTDILVIDEVSMLSAEFLEKINYILQNVLRSKKFFGGIQVVFSCDPMQLLPVFNKFSEKEVDTRLFVESELVNNFTVCILKENFRQKNCLKYSEILSRLRVGEHTEDDIQSLRTRLIDFDTPEEPVRLVSTNKKASFINDKKLKDCRSEPFTSRAIYFSKGDDSETRKMLEAELKKQFVNRNLDTLILKVGARVMLLRNMDLDNGLVNGATGVIQKIMNGQPYVKFDIGISSYIEPVEWEVEMSGNRAVAVQIPLTLGYAITIHKSQSLTLNHAILDLKDCFCDAQVYVALSRVISLDNIFLKSFDEKKIKVNEIMRKFVECHSK